MKKVLVIVVVYNGLHWLERCLSSVRGANVFVVDNDSTDGSADWIQSHFPEVTLLRSAENLGFSKANNLGFLRAMDKGYDYVYLLNQDAWLEEGALEKLVAAAQAHPEYAVLSPLQFQDGYQALDCQFAKLYSGTVLPLNRTDGKAAGVFEGAAPPCIEPEARDGGALAGAGEDAGGNRPFQRESFRLLRAGRRLVPPGAFPWKESGGAAVGPGGP